MNLYTSGSNKKLESAALLLRTKRISDKCKAVQSINVTIGSNIRLLPYLCFLKNLIEERKREMQSRKLNRGFSFARTNLQPWGSVSQMQLNINSRVFNLPQSAR